MRKVGLFLGLAFSIGIGHIHALSVEAPADAAKSRLSAQAVSVSPFGDIALLITDRPITVSMRDDIAAAARFAGGHISIVFPPNVIVGRIPAASLSQLVGRHGIRLARNTPVDISAIGVTDPKAQAGVRYFNWVASGEKAREEARTKDTRVDLSVLKEHLIPIAVPPRAGKSGQALGPAHHTIFPNDVMDGWNTVDIFYVESIDDPGTPENENEFSWSEPHYYDTVNRLVDGFLWWVDIASLLNIQPALYFWMAHHSPWDWRQQVPFEPIRRQPILQNQDFDWIGPITANHGVTEGSNSRTRSRAYAAAQRAYYGSKNGWVAFVVYNPPGAPTEFADGYSAYAIFGDYVQILYKVSAFPVEQTGWVFAHEIGHVFWACDEHAGNCPRVCENCYLPGQGPRPGSMNWNCVLCGGTTACIMQTVDSYTWVNHSTCPHTRAMIGWPY